MTITRKIALVAVACGLVVAVDRVSAAVEGCDQHAGTGECLIPPPTPVTKVPTFAGRSTIAPVPRR